MFKRFSDFMGESRLRLLFLWLALTGLLSLILNVIVNDFAWVRPVQSALALSAIIGATAIILSRMDGDERRRWIAILAPALGALILAFTVLPQFSLPLVGAAVGWVVTGALIFRARTPDELKAAVKALRKSDYEGAVSAMDAVIKADPRNPNHYRFRAEVLRFWGKLDRARRDYARMTELEPDSPIGYNGLAEVHLQGGDFDRALTAAGQAAERAPGMGDEWVAWYNLGMIEDRLRDSAAALEHLDRALALSVPDARHRLLIHLYRARASVRQGDMDAAAEALAEMRRNRGGLEEWQKLLASDQAQTLRAVLGDDVAAAAALLDGERDLASLNNSGATALEAAGTPAHTSRTTRAGRKA